MVGLGKAVFLLEFKNWLNLNMSWIVSYPFSALCSVNIEVTQGFYFTHQSRSNDPFFSTETCWRRLQSECLGGTGMEPLTCTAAVSPNEEWSFKMVQVNCLIRAAMSLHLHGWSWWLNYSSRTGECWGSRSSLRPIRASRLYFRICGGHRCFQWWWRSLNWSKWCPFLISIIWIYRILL